MVLSYSSRLNGVTNMHTSTATVMPSNLTRNGLRLDRKSRDPAISPPRNLPTAKTIVQSDVGND